MPEFLIAAELARGDLVRAFEGPLQNTERYYLAWPTGSSSHPPLQDFRTWIKGAANA